MRQKNSLRKTTEGVFDESKVCYWKYRGKVHQWSNSSVQNASEKLMKLKFNQKKGTFKTSISERHPKLVHILYSFHLVVKGPQPGSALEVHAWTFWILDRKVRQNCCAHFTSKNQPLIWKTTILRASASSFLWELVHLSFNTSGGDSPLVSTDIRCFSTCCDWIPYRKHPIWRLARYRAV